MADLTRRDSLLCGENSAGVISWAACAPRLIGRLAPLTTAPRMGGGRLVVRAVGRLGACDARCAAAAVQVLHGLVYAGNARLRGTGVTTLARLVARYPMALGAAPWRWRAQVAGAAAEDPRLRSAATQLLAACPRRARPVPAREAPIWAELGRPVTNVKF